jgi:hypothetical protein
VNFLFAIKIPSVVLQGAHIYIPRDVPFSIALVDRIPVTCRKGNNSYGKGIILESNLECENCIVTHFSYSMAKKKKLKINMPYYLVLDIFEGVDIYIVILLKQMSTCRHITNFDTNIYVILCQKQNTDWGTKNERVSLLFSHYIYEGNRNLVNSDVKSLYYIQMSRASGKLKMVYCSLFAITNI